MKIVFLDIDGVLNTSKQYHEYRTIKSKETLEGADWDQYSFNELLFGKEHIDVLNNLIEKTGAKIVISSTWRRFYSGRIGRRPFADLVALLKKVGIKGDVIGKTPDQLETKFSQQVSRGTEIQEWLNEHKDLGVEAFVILDDDSDMDHLKMKMVQTDYRYGLTPSDGEQAIIILST